MSERDEDFRRLAAVMGWEWCAALQEYECLPEGGMIYFIDTPDPDASLHRHLEFVGRIAEEVVPTINVTSRLIQQDFVEGVLRKCKADTDLAWAAVRAAIEAKGVK